MRALSHNVDQRYQTAETFADALEAAARVSGVGIAKPKKVGELIRQVGPPIAEEKRARAGDAEDITPATDPVKRAPALIDDEVTVSLGPSDEISEPSAPAAQQLSQPTEPSGVFGTSWTHTEAIVNATPPARSRHGLIAAIVAGSVVGLIVVALVAVATTSDDGPTSAAPPQPPATLSEPPKGVTDEPSYLNEPEPEPEPPAPQPTIEQPAPKADAPAPKAAPKAVPPTPSPRAVPRPRPRPRPQPTTDPKPAGTNFRPPGL
jgi:hypothetical protein